MVSIVPWKIDIMAYSLPTDLVIIGSVVSIEVAPPEDIGASLPKYFAKNGVSSRVIISLIMFDTRAITPIVSPLILVMSILDRL